jgi:hypothetical protein
MKKNKPNFFLKIDAKEAIEKLEQFKNSVSS